jgi:hypothetical protein
MQKVLIQSEAFSQYCGLMKWLKHNKVPGFHEKMRPKICLNCWEIFSRDSELYHSDSTHHKVTNDFSKMAEADKNALIKLATNYKKFEGINPDDKEATIVLFKVDPKIQAMASKELGFNSGNVEPEKAIPKVQVVVPKK